MARVVLIGAGLTNLSVAYHLEQAGFTDYKMFEKESSAGGLCRSLYQDGFTFDYTGHLLHVNDEYFKQFLQTISSLDDFVGINRRSYIYSHGVYTHYPFQVNLYGLPPAVIAECIQGYVQRPQFKKKNISFYDWALQQFGPGIVKHFFADYQEKIFAYDSKKIASSWTGRFVPPTSLEAIIQGALQPPVNQAIGYNASFLYPKAGGINFWVQKLAQRVKQPVATNYCVEQIDVTNKIITFTNGDFEHYETLISTLPLPALLDMIKEPASASLKKASKKLLCSSVLNINLGLSKPDISDKHWIYLPEKQFLPYRVGFYHNFTPTMAPAGCSSLYAEAAYQTWSADDKQRAITTTIQQLQKLLGFNDADIATQKVLDIKHAYVIYDFWRERNIEALHARLQAYNINAIGRYGAWKYSSMQEAVLEGKLMAESVMQTSPTTLGFVQKPSLVQGRPA